MGFSHLFSHPGILKALEEAGYSAPTPIQEKAIPEIIKGNDIRGSAQTGTGKTAAFILPSLVRISGPAKAKCKGPRILVLVPTRDLAIQVAAEATKYSKYLTQVKTVCIYGGAPYPVQNRELSRHYEILVATPGRLIDHMERGRIDFGRLELLILDEADRMLDMGFIDAVEEIIKATPEDRQTLLFSATLKGSVLNLAKRFMKNPVEISVDSAHAKHENIEQKLHNVENLSHKYRLLDELLTDAAIQQAIIFTATKRQADNLVDKLCENGERAGVLHGDMKQSHRMRTVNELRKGKIRLLVATDVASRGIDIPQLSHVINFDLPMSPEDYVHRIGRTGRAGAKGVALSFVTNKEVPQIKRIERFTGHKFVLDGFAKERSGDQKADPNSKKPFKRSKNFKDFRGKKEFRFGNNRNRKNRPPKQNRAPKPAFAS